MEWSEFQSVKKRLPDGWKVDEDTGTLSEDGYVILSHPGDKEMFRALVADALYLHEMGVD